MELRRRPKTGATPIINLILPAQAGAVPLAPRNLETRSAT